MQSQSPAIPCPQRGFMFIEAIISIALLGIIGSVFLPLLPQITRTAKNTAIRQQLMAQSHYVLQYIYRWADFSAADRPVPFEFYRDGDELELLVGEHRINQMIFGDVLTKTGEALPDEFKAKLVFEDTASRNRSAVIKATIWYDTNLNDIPDAPTENVITICTVVTEKRIH